MSDQNQQNHQVNNHQNKQQNNQNCSTNNKTQTPNQKQTSQLTKHKSNLSRKSMRSLGVKTNTRNQNNHGKIEEKASPNNLDMRRVKKTLFNNLENDKKEKFKDLNLRENSEIDSCSERTGNSRNTPGLRGQLIRDIKYEELSKRYTNEQYTIKILSMVHRIIYRHDFARQLNSHFQVHTIMLKMCKFLLLNELELSMLSLFIDKISFKNEDFLDFNNYIYILGILVKHKFSNQASTVVNQIFLENKGLEDAYKHFVSLRLDNIKHNILEVAISELNDRFLELSIPFNTHCKENFVDYNYCVDQVLSMSVPYSENKKNTNMKTFEQTISVPNFKTEHTPRNLNNNNLVNPFCENSSNNTNPNNNINCSFGNYNTGQFNCYSNGNNKLYNLGQNYNPQNNIFTTYQAPFPKPASQINPYANSNQQHINRIPAINTTSNNNFNPKIFNTEDRSVCGTIGSEVQMNNSFNIKNSNNDKSKIDSVIKNNPFRQQNTSTNSSNDLIGQNEQKAFSVERNDNVKTISNNFTGSFRAYDETERISKVLGANPQVPRGAIVSENGNVMFPPSTILLQSNESFNGLGDIHRFNSNVNMNMPQLNHTFSHGNSFGGQEIWGFGQTGVFPGNIPVYDARFLGQKRKGVEEESVLSKKNSTISINQMNTVANNYYPNFYPNLESTFSTGLYNPNFASKEHYHIYLFNLIFF